MQSKGRSRSISEACRSAAAGRQGVGGASDGAAAARAKAVRRARMMSMPLCVEPFGEHDCELVEDAFLSSPLPEIGGGEEVRRPRVCRRCVIMLVHVRTDAMLVYIYNCLCCCTTEINVEIEGIWCVESLANTSHVFHLHLACTPPSSWHTAMLEQPGQPRQRHQQPFRPTLFRHGMAGGELKWRRCHCLPFALLRKCH